MFWLNIFRSIFSLNIFVFFIVCTCCCVLKLFISFIPNWGNSTFFGIVRVCISYEFSAWWYRSMKLLEFRWNVRAEGVWTLLMDAQWDVIDMRRLGMLSLLLMPNKVKCNTNIISNNDQEFDSKVVRMSILLGKLLLYNLIADTILHNFLPQKWQISEWIGEFRHLLKSSINNNNK